MLFEEIKNGSVPLKHSRVSAMAACYAHPLPSAGRQGGEPREREHVPIHCSKMPNRIC